jgi:hypothetical protein
MCIVTGVLASILVCTADTVRVESDIICVLADCGVPEPAGELHRGGLWAGCVVGGGLHPGVHCRQQGGAVRRKGRVLSC